MAIGQNKGCPNNWAAFVFFSHIRANENDWKCPVVGRK